MAAVTSSWGPIAGASSSSSPVAARSALLGPRCSVRAARSVLLGQCCSVSVARSVLLGQAPHGPEFGAHASGLGQGVEDGAGDVGGVHEGSLFGVGSAEASVGCGEGRVDARWCDDGGANSLAAQLAVQGVAEVDLCCLGRRVHGLLPAADEKPGHGTDDDDVTTAVLLPEVSNGGAREPDGAQDVDVQHQPDLVGAILE